MQVKILVTSIDMALYHSCGLWPMKSLKEVALTSTLGTFATLVLVVVAVHGLILDFHNPIYADVHHSIVVFSHLSTAVATISMCFGGNAIYFHDEESMRYPKSWNRVMAAALASYSALYLVTIFGYIEYGDRAEFPILNNLPKVVFTKVGTTSLSPTSFLLRLFRCRPLPWILSA